MYKMDLLTPLEAYAQFLIAQSIMSEPSLGDSLDYVEAWDIASTLLYDFMESEDFDRRTRNLSYSLVENWVNNIPVEQLK